LTTRAHRQTRSNKDALKNLSTITKGNDMDYKGIIIEESLKDKTVLDSIIITDTKIEPVTEAHKTPWLKQWTLHTITIPANRAEKLAEQLSHCLNDNYWYADYRNPTTHYIIFPGKVFRIDRTRQEQYEAVKAYGMSLGIPEHQLTWSAELQEP